MLAVGNSQTGRREARNCAAIRRFHQRFSEALQRRIGEVSVQTVHYDDKRQPISIRQRRRVIRTEDRTSPDVHIAVA